MLGHYNPSTRESRPYARQTLLSITRCEVQTHTYSLAPDRGCIFVVLLINDELVPLAGPMESTIFGTTYFSNLVGTLYYVSNIAIYQSCMALLNLETQTASPIQCPRSEIICIISLRNCGDSIDHLLSCPSWIMIWFSLS